MNITIGVNVLQAALVIAPSKDTRYILNGVCISPQQCGLFVVATNGAALFVDRISDEAHDTPEIIIPFDAVKAAVLKKKGSINLCTTENVLGNVKFTPIEGRFPDWKRVIPSKRSGLAGNFDWEFVAEAQKVMRLASSRPRGVFKLNQNGNDAAEMIVSYSDFPKVVLMPWNQHRLV